MRLEQGIAALELTLPAGAADKYAAYLSLLAKWNKTYNLTAIRDPEVMVTHHLLDALAVLPTLQKSALAGWRLVDVGSGAGLPGIVLAIARPDWSVVSVEAAEKKVAFQRQAKIELKLGNFHVHGGRVELLKECFDGAISRAFASLSDYIAVAGHLAPRLWAMKGEYPADEIAALPADWGLAACDELSVPGLDARRHLLRLEKN